MASNKTVIVTGASHGIGEPVVQAFLGRGYNVVATSRSVSKAGFAPSPNLALVDGDIGQAATAANIAQDAANYEAERERDQFRRVCARAVGIGRSPTAVNPHVAAVGPAQLLQPLQEGREASLSFPIAGGPGRTRLDDL
jgi:NAD(P)-dependent dehydrogenase (short-subunit alcohol dehydrogenase family)